MLCLTFDVTLYAFFSVILYKIKLPYKDEKLVRGEGSEKKIPTILIFEMLLKPEIEYDKVEREKNI